MNSPLQRRTRSGTCGGTTLLRRAGMSCDYGGSGAAEAAARDKTYALIARTCLGESRSLKDGMPRDSRIPPSTIAANC
jgi:hypothetical protein